MTCNHKVHLLNLYNYILYETNKFNIDRIQVELYKKKIDMKGHWGQNAF